MDMYDRIRNRRKELKMTQDELAKLTGYNDRSSIAKIEAKKADLSQSKIIAFAKALKVTTSYLMDGEEQLKKYPENRVIAERVKLKREELGLSQEELAEKMGYKSKTSIHKIEQGITDLPLSKVEELAKVLDLKVAYLMGWTEEKPQPQSNFDKIKSQLTPEELIQLEKFNNMSTVMFMNEGNNISDEDKETLAIAYAEVLISQRKK